MPPGCRTIAFSQWGGFTAAPEQVTPTGELKASDLQTLKRVNTNSELTRSFEMVSIKEEKKQTMAEKFALEGLNCEDLPSAFDSDDEEEDYDIRHAR
ncbi:hypothetical protein J4E90_005352 [Alternaria incomplexa]|uniref:uncharacterized protein n=1 Tax=Alternaria incomplexa TaxID=1187928 RepID=UPI00222127F8|nr:uncharacterized protein J4E90_005352 [Alternaria incomplexa]KAI4913633.1 hypothetical protein J4E90_005352 [Alternaria incomplexa]